MVLNAPPTQEEGEEKEEEEEEEDRKKARHSDIHRQTDRQRLKGSQEHRTSSLVLGLTGENSSGPPCQ